MSALTKFLLQLDNGQTVEIPAPPAATGGLSRALVVVNGVLSWGAGSAGSNGYYKPLSNGDAENPSVVFADGSVVMIWVTD